MAVRGLDGLVVVCALLLGIGQIFSLDSNSEQSASAQADELAGGAAHDALRQQPATAKRPVLHVPDGFVVDRVADDLGLQFPMFGTFADDGRLFVAESSGHDLHAELKAGTRNCRIRVLEDNDGDGRFDTARVFADKLVCPMGLAWRDGKLYVADPPDVIVFTDRRRRWSRRQPPGNPQRLRTRNQWQPARPGVWSGRHAVHDHGKPRRVLAEAARRHGAVMATAAHSFVAGRTAADPEVLCRGFVNLIEMAFTARGDIIGTDNWYQRPEGGLRDALVHLVDGGLYPYLADTGTRYPITGKLLPPVRALSGRSAERARVLSGSDVSQ